MGTTEGGIADKRVASPVVISGVVMGTVMILL
jgi:hypothetical protein